MKLLILIICLVLCGCSSNDNNNIVEYNHTDTFEPLTTDKIISAQEIFDNVMIDKEVIDNVDKAEPQELIDSMMDMADYTSDNINETYNSEYLDTQLKDITFDVVKELIKDIYKNGFSTCEVLAYPENIEVAEFGEEVFYRVKLDDKEYVIVYQNEQAYAVEDIYNKQ